MLRIAGELVSHSPTIRTPGTRAPLESTKRKRIRRAPSPKVWLGKHISLDEFDALGKKQIAEAEAKAVNLTDAVFWRALMLIGAFFVGLCGWTVLRWKLGK